jgi:hypothetical protein
MIYNRNEFNAEGYKKKKGKEKWCGRRDSNSHTLRHQNLNLACLPIPPRPRTVFRLLYSEFFSKTNHHQSIVNGADGETRTLTPCGTRT